MQKRAQCFISDLLILRLNITMTYNVRGRISHSLVGASRAALKVSQNLLLEQQQMPCQVEREECMILLDKIKFLLDQQHQLL